MRSLFERVRCSAWRRASSSSFSVAFALSNCIVRLCCDSFCARNLRSSSSVRSNSLHCMIASMKTWSVPHASFIFTLSVTVCEWPTKCCSQAVQNCLSRASDHPLRQPRFNPLFKCFPTLENPLRRALDHTCLAAKNDTLARLVSMSKV